MGTIHLQFVLDKKACQTKTYRMCCTAFMNVVVVSHLVFQNYYHLHCSHLISVSPTSKTQTFKLFRLYVPNCCCRTLNYIAPFLIPASLGPFTARFQSVIQLDFIDPSSSLLFSSASQSWITLNSPVLDWLKLPAARRKMSSACSTIAPPKGWSWVRFQNFDAVGGCILQLPPRFALS